MPHDKPEFSRPFDIESLAAGEVEVKLSARTEEREALAQRFGLARLEDLRAELRISSSGKPLNTVRVEGTMAATVEQTCVVTLDPLRSELSGPIVRLFREGPAVEDEAEVEVELDDVDSPDLLEGGTIDLGELVSEQLGLEIDPFPRKPGVVFEYRDPREDDGGSPQDPANPFAKLAELKKRMGE